MEQFNSNIVVVGDIMIDHNIDGKYVKIANEASIPVLNVDKNAFQLGGCGNVFLNILKISPHSSLVTIVGNDENGEKIKNMFATENIFCRQKTVIADGYNILAKTSNSTIITSNRKTTTKNRIFSGQNLLFRYDYEDTFPISADEEEILYNAVISKNPSIICISDYNKGVMTFNLCRKIINYAKLHNIPTIVDPKGNYYKYKDCTIIKPNRQEVKEFIKNNFFNVNEINDIHTLVKKELKCDISVITLAQDGISWYKDTHIYHTLSKKRDIIDVTGAGDIVLAILSLFYTKLDIGKICCMSTYIASKSVEHLGTYQLTNSDIIESMQISMDITKIEIDALVSTKYITVEQFKLLNLNGKIVFTNGCFDVLHDGHVHLLRECKKLGDKVVVGINSDESIRQLKGDKRPFNCLERRVNVLSSLIYVDYIISFSSLSPIDLLDKLRPDVLVKGSDYTIDKLKGIKFVKEVVLVDILEGRSSTSTIKFLSENHP